MDPAYASSYRVLYEEHWWWRARERVVLGELEARRPPSGYGRILDVGCGDGLFFDALRPHGTPEGVEPDSGLITEVGRAAGTIHVRPFDTDFRPAHPFGLVLMLDVLEHLEDDVAAATHAGSLLGPGGLLLLTVPAMEAIWTAHDDINHHYRRYNRGQVRRLLEAAGLSIIDCRYLFQWTVPTKLLIRAREALYSSPQAMATVPVAPVNRLLGACTMFETRTIAKMNPPFGSSILAIAQASL